MFWLFVGMMLTVLVMKYAVFVGPKKEEKEVLSGFDSAQGCRYPGLTYEPDLSRITRIQDDIKEIRKAYE